MSNVNVAAIVNVLWRLGDEYSGGSESRVWEVAGEWVACGFTATEVLAWGKVGFWAADAADECRAIGLTPARAVARAAAIAEDCGCDGDPIYALCNADIDIEWFIRGD